MSSGRRFGEGGSRLRNFITRYLTLILLLAVPAAAPARLIPEKRTYRPLDLFDNGYKDSIQKDGTWRIVANSRPMDGPGFAWDMALYRAAELARQSGHPYFQIFDSHGAIGTGLYVRGREMVRIVVRGSDSAAAPADCRVKDKQSCITHETAEILARIGPTLRMGS